MPVDKFGNEVRQRTTTVKSDEGISLNFANNTYIRLDGESDITGNLNMALRKIENLGEPTNPKDATSKEYVDNTKGTGVIGEVKDETATLKGNLDFEDRYRIKNLPNPVDGKDAVNRKYVENLAINHPFQYVDNQYQAKDDLDLRGFKIKNLCSPFEDGDAATKGYLDTQNAAFLKVDQGIYEAKTDINMDKLYTVYNVKAPIDEGHVTDKKYVDEQINLNSAFAFKNGSYYAKGGLILRKNKLGGLREPSQDGEAANKKYVDDKIHNLFLDDNDNIAFGLNVDMEGNQVLNLPEPAADHEPATKKYVDDLQTQHVDEKGNIKFGRSINLDRNRIFSMKEPTKPSEGANKKYVDDTITKRIQEEKDIFLPQDPATKNYVDEAIRGIAAGDVLVSKEGVFIKENGHYRATAPLDIDNQKMENLPDPVDDKDAVNKKYIDGVVENLTLKQGLVRENGGFNLVDSYINMNFHNIRNVGTPKDKSDAVPRSFVDGEINTVIKRVENQFNELNQLVSICGSFHGNLKNNEYQFTFGGPILEKDAFSYFKTLNGFLVPANGLLKHFVTFSSGIILTIPGKTMFEILNENLKPVIDLYGSKDSLVKIFTLERIGKYVGPEKIGGIYFKLKNIKKINETYEGDMDFNFILEEKFKNKEENFICSVNQGDIINIKSEYEEDKDYNIEGSTSLHLFNSINRKFEGINFTDRTFHLTTLTFLFKEMNFPNVLDD